MINSLIFPSSYQRVILTRCVAFSRLMSYTLLNLIFGQLIIILLIYFFHLYLSLIPHFFYISQAPKIFQDVGF